MTTHIPAFSGMSPIPTFIIITLSTCRHCFDAAAIPGPFSALNLSFRVVRRLYMPVWPGSRLGHSLYGLNPVGIFSTCKVDRLDFLLKYKFTVLF